MIINDCIYYSKENFMKHIPVSYTHLDVYKRQALVFLLVYNIPHLIIKYYCTFMGYSFGVNLMKNVSGSGILDKITTVSYTHLC